MARIFVWIVFLSAVGLASSAEAQQLKKGELSGTVVTASVVAPAATSVPLYTTPSKGFVVLTQLCRVQGDFTEGSVTSPSLPQLRPSSDDCETYDPGLALGPAETLECHGFNGAAVVCTITGVHVKK